MSDLLSNKSTTYRRSGLWALWSERDQHWLTDCCLTNSSV